MSAKHTIFPPGEFPEDDMYTGHAVAPESGPDASRQRARAAYAAQDEMPPYEPGTGGNGGLFAGETGNAEAEEESGAEDLLSVISPDALRDECRKKVCPECTVKKESDDAQLRALADLENAKKRLEREHGEQIRFAAEKILTDIMPSLDNLDLALRHAENQADACKDFIVGVRMTQKLLLEALAKHGLEAVGVVGEEFDPAVHEAVGMVASPDVPDGHISGLLSGGYKLKERLLRPARVVVCKK